MVPMDIFNTEPQPPATQLHRIAWFIHDEVTFELQCLHDKVPHPFVCDKEAAEDEPSIFLESFDGDRAPLRDGIVKTWWTGSNEDYELAWKYASDPALDSPVGPTEEMENLLVELRELEASFGLSWSEEIQRRTVFSASYAFEEAERRVREIRLRHVEPDDTTDADVLNLAALSDEIGYCLFFRPATALSADSPAGQKVNRLAEWIHTTGWRRTGPVLPLDKFAS